MAVQTSVRLHVGELILDGRRLEGREDVTTGAAFELEVMQAEALVVADVLGKAGFLELLTEVDGRGVAVYVTRVVAIATSGTQTGRRYRLTLRSALAFLELTRRPRIFQHLSVPEIVEAVLTQGAYAAGNYSKKLAAAHGKQEYLVQYDETDHDFVRRLCESGGADLPDGGAEPPSRGRRGGPLPDTQAALRRIRCVALRAQGRDR